MVSEGEVWLVAGGNALLHAVGSLSSSVLGFTRDGVKNAEVDVVGIAGGTAAGSNLWTNSLYSCNARSLPKVSSGTEVREIEY